MKYGTKINNFINRLSDIVHPYIYVQQLFNTL